MASVPDPIGLAAPRPAIDRQMARSLAGALALADRHGFARRLAAGVLGRYLRLSGLPPPSVAAPGLAPLAGSDDVETLATGLADLHDVQQAAHLIGTLYTAALPDEHRAAHGVFYTPPPLVDHLLDMAQEAGTDWRAARVLDPACGAGAFLIAAATRMMAAHATTDPALALRRIGLDLRGFEIDPFAAWLAQALLEAALAPLARAAGRPVPQMVAVRDSLELRAGDAAGFDLVAGNPPYGRVTLPPERRAVFARGTYGHANLYGLFTDAALRWVRPGGLVAYVTPTSMLSGLYHTALRALLAGTAPPVAVDLVDERAGVFDDVLQETMLTVYRRTAARRPRQGRIGFLRVAADGRVSRRDAGRFSLPPDPKAPWLLPRAPDQVALARHLRAMPHRLADYGYGVSTGPLVWNRFKPQFRAGPGGACFPVVWAESVTPDGRFLWRAERRNHAPWFRADLPRDAWLLVDRPCVLLQRTTAKEQARRLIAAELPEAFIAAHGAVIVENHLNMVRAIVARPPVPPAAIAALLNSGAADRAFRCINGSVAVSAFELEAMPVPPPAVMGKVARLLTRHAPAASIEAVIAAAYDATTA